MSAFYSLLFLGGWLDITGTLFSYAVLDLFLFTLKTIFICFLFLLIRSILPRYRYDQLMFICWKKFLPFVFSYVIFIIFFFILVTSIPESRHVEFNYLSDFLYSDYRLISILLIVRNSWNLFKKWIWDFGIHLILKKDESLKIRVFKILVWAHMFSGGLALVIKELGGNTTLIGIICTFYAIRVLWILIVDFKNEFYKTEKRRYLGIAFILFILFAYMLFYFLLFIIKNV